MKHKGITLSILAMVCTASAANDDFANRPLVLQPPLRPEPVLLKNIVYQASSGRLLDAYLPSMLAPTEVKGAIIFVHGDADPETLKSPKDWRCFQDYGRLTASAGLIGITFNYRSSQDGRQLAEADQDVLDAIQFIRRESAMLHVDPDRLGLWFFSSGGNHLALTLRTKIDGVKAVAASYAGLFPNPRYLTPDQWRRYGAAYHLSGNPTVAPSLLLVRCGLDSPFINQPMDNFTHEAVTKNYDLELINLPAAPHAFDVVYDSPETKSTIRRIYSWFQDKLY